MGDFLIILFSLRKSKYEKEIIEILKKHNVNYCSDKNITQASSTTYCVSAYKVLELNTSKAVVIFTEKSSRFALQKFPINIIGICADNNISALSCFKNSRNAVITCGTNNKNTITISSINDQYVLITLQRSIINIKGKKIDPCEFKIKLTKQYSTFAIMAAATALILNDIEPICF